MFKFFKDKIKKVLHSVSKKIEDKVKKEEKEKKKVKKIEKKEKKKKEKVEKAEKKVEEIEKKAEEKIEKEEEETEKEEKKGFFTKIKEKIVTVKINEVEFDDIFGSFEMALIENNVAMKAIDYIKENLKKEIIDKPIKRSEIENNIKEKLKESIQKLLIEPFDLVKEIKEKKTEPYVIVFFGINGSGKTTTIAKICNLLQKNSLSCVLAASDTFRAASIEQLEKHASNLKIKVIKHEYGADPAAVAYDAIAHAKAKGIDVVLIDTAGRMHTQANLMSEMEKICRVAKPNMRIFVGEAIVGNDAVEQAKAFNESIGIDAIILSKADVDEKGGASISVSYVTKKPIIYLGTGQEYKDLGKFDPQEIIKSLGLD